MRAQQIPFGGPERRGAGMDETPDIWALIFEQTPQAIRWLLGALTLGLFTLASLIWRWHRDEMQRIEREAHESRREAHERIDREVQSIHTRLDEIYQAVLRADGGGSR